MTVDTLHAPLDLGDVLAPIGVERFFADHWQRRMLALDIDQASFSRVKNEIGPLDIARLAGLAKGGTQAWIANEHLAHSMIPVDATNAADFFALGATLYFLNVPLERLTAGVAAFLGAPRQRIIASIFLTPASGGASVHFDMHENFTVQLTGAKRWHVGAAPCVAAPTEGYILGQRLPLSMAGAGTIKEDTPNTVDLRPGSLLYVPRGTQHRTEAGEQSWSVNLSYYRTMWLDILEDGLKRRLAGSAKWRGTVTGLGNQCPPAAQIQNILPGLMTELREILADPRELENFCRDFLDRSGN
ncbi:MAG TPA: cupin domain-containing protein [Rhizomicrobium sp.]|jgi:ribosomal protein L16 Arg81 hydroxylase|nr:cupin domain-containing protein [Rhizomicrobium sp.]